MTCHTKRNAGILTAKPQLHKLSDREKRMMASFGVRLEPEVIMVPLWRVIIVTLGLCIMSASFAYSVRPAPEVVTKVVRVPAPAAPAPQLDGTGCKPISQNMRNTQYAGWVKQIAATLPASAIAAGKKW